MTEVDRIIRKEKQNKIDKEKDKVMDDVMELLKEECC